MIVMIVSDENDIGRGICLYDAPRGDLYARISVDKKTTMTLPLDFFDQRIGAPEASDAALMHSWAGIPFPQL